MTWNAFHHREEILRTVVATADRRRDGLLPMHATGVSETFRDELDLLGALMLKWHARLSGNIERALMSQPLDLEGAMATAWATTAEQLPGIRAILDRCTAAPDGPEMAQALARAERKEWVRLAAAAGLANDASAAAMRAGRGVVERARHQAVAPEPEQSQPTAEVADKATTPVPEASFVDRIKAVIAA